jgi:hypothetical protein
MSEHYDKLTFNHKLSVTARFQVAYGWSGCLARPSMLKARFAAKAIHTKTPFECFVPVPLSIHRINLPRRRPRPSFKNA